MKQVIRISLLLLVASCMFDHCIAQSDYKFWFETGGVKVSYKWSCQNCSDRHIRLKVENTNGYQIKWNYGPAIWSSNGVEVGRDKLGATGQIQAYQTQSGDMSGWYFYPPEGHVQDHTVTLRFESFVVKNATEAETGSKTNTTETNQQNTGSQNAEAEQKRNEDLQRQEMEYQQKKEDELRKQKEAERQKQESETAKYNQQTETSVNNAQNPNNTAITQSMYLNQAKITNSYQQQKGYSNSETQAQRNQIATMQQQNLTTSFNSLIDSWSKVIQARSAGGYDRIDARDKATKIDIDNTSGKYGKDNILYYFYEAQLGYNILIGFDNSHNNCVCYDYYPREKDYLFDYDYIKIPKDLPDLFRIPGCNSLQFKGESNNTRLDSIFFYLRDSEKCNNIWFQGHQYKLKTNKKVRDEFNEKKALEALRKELVNLAAPSGTGNVDAIKYSNAFLWYAHLQNKYAATLEELLEGRDLVAKYKYRQSHETGMMGVYGKFIDYYAFLFKYRIGLEQGQK